MNNTYSFDDIGDFIRHAENSTAFIPPKIIAHTPDISDDDVESGYIIRYFIKFFNHAHVTDIIEVSDQTYEECTSNPFFRCIKIRWLISGRTTDEYTLNPDGSKLMLYTGVKTANEQEIKLKTTAEFRLDQLLTDPLQFYHDNSRIQ